MRKKILLLIGILFIQLIPADVSSQNLIRLTNGYIDKNPVFGTIPPMNWAGFSFEFIAFERYASINSSIVVLKMGPNNVMDTSYIITNTFIKRNPSLAYSKVTPSYASENIKKAFVVWETNQNGNFDIFGSLYSSTTGWTNPVAITGTGNEITPNIFAIDTNHFILSFERDGDIIFKRYVNNLWLADTNLTSTETQPCHKPFIYFDSPTIIVTYEKEINAIQRQICFRKKTGVTDWAAQDTIANLGFNKNLGFGPGGYGRFICIFESNRLGNWNIYHTDIFSDNTKQQSTVLIDASAQNTGFIANSVPIIVDYYYPMISSYLKKKQDSTKIISAGYSGYSPPVYIGDTTKNTKIALNAGTYYANMIYRSWIVFSKDTLSFTNLYAIGTFIYLSKIKNIRSEIPNQFSLSQNYPNPFNPTTNIRFSIPPYASPFWEGGKGDVLLKVFDILGNEVSTLVNEQLKPGTYEVEFNGDNYASGVYYYTLQTESFKETKRMVLIK